MNIKPIEPTLPYLCIQDLQQVREIIYEENKGLGPLISRNYLGQEQKPIYERKFLTAFKGLNQVEHIISVLKKLKVCLTDFEECKFDTHIDEYNRNRLDDFEFEPYAFVNSILSSTLLESLPYKIEFYSELVLMISQLIQRNKANDVVFYGLFKGMNKGYPIKDENGIERIVPESEFSPGTLADLKLDTTTGEALKFIQLEQCLDNYDAWWKMIKSMIWKKLPFSEINRLIKE